MLEIVLLLPRCNPLPVLCNLPNDCSSSGSYYCCHFCRPWPYAAWAGIQHFPKINCCPLFSCSTTITQEMRPGILTLLKVLSFNSHSSFLAFLPVHPVRLQTPGRRTKLRRHHCKPVYDPSTVEISKFACFESILRTPCLNPAVWTPRKVWSICYEVVNHL